MEGLALGLKQQFTLQSHLSTVYFCCEKGISYEAFQHLSTQIGLVQIPH